MKKIAIFVALLLCLTLLVVSCKKKGEEGAATSNQETPVESTVGGDTPEDPENTEPGATEPGATEPGATEPGVTEPGVTEPGATEPATTEPIVTVDPVYQVTQDPSSGYSPVVPF